MNLRLFGKNTIIYGIGNIGLRASAFLLIPLYTHALSVNDYGLLATLLLTIQIMAILMSVGMQTALLRFAKEYEAKYLMGELLGSSLLINVIAGIMVAGVTIVFCQSFFHTILHSESVGNYITLAGCAAMVQTLCLHVMSYYQAKNEALKFALVGASAALLLIISNFVFLLVFQLGLKGALIASIMAYGLVLLVVSIDVLVKRTGVGIEITIVPKLLRFGFPLIFSMLGQVIMGASSIYFLSFYEGLEVVAVYSLGFKLATVVGIVLTLPFQLAFQPFVFGNIDQPDLKETMARLFTYFFVSVALISIPILLISRALLPFIAPPEYSSAYLVIILILPAMAGNGLIIFGETLLSVAKKTQVIGVVVGICAALSLLLNYGLIPVMGWYGAIVATNASSILAGLVILLFGMKAFYIPIEWSRTGIALGIFSYFVILAFLLQEANSLIFYGGAIISICLILPFAKLLRFFDDRERVAIRGLLQGIKLNLCQ